MDEWTKDQLNYLRNEMDELSKAVYGDSREKINGGGLYGELRRFRAEMVRSGDEREGRLKALENQVRKLVDRQHPAWWDYVIVGGGLFMGLVAILQIILFIVIYQILR